MHITSLFALLLALPLSAYSAEKSVDSREISAAMESAIFGKLELLFKTGTAPAFPPGPLIGFSGRCYDRGHENAVKGAAYLVSDDVGPNGPMGGGKKILSIWSDDLTEYDRTCTGDIIRAGVSWSPTCVENGSLVAFIDGTTGSFLRAVGGDYIEKIATHLGTGASHYCYYNRTMDP